MRSDRCGPIAWPLNSSPWDRRPPTHSEASRRWSRRRAFPQNILMPTHDHTIDEPTLIGRGPAMDWLRSAATRVAAGHAKVLVTGESGVGKDLVARFIHARSQRAARAFVALNCAGISETLLESELFGHVRGSFTGAHRDKVGLFQLANRGTVFLDEVGEMSLRMQALLLRFLENGEVKPVGSDSVSARSTCA